LFEDAAMRTACSIASLLVAAALLYPAQENLDGPQLIRLGRLGDALRVYLAAAEASPKSVADNNGVGVVLDLLGRYPEARRYFLQAIKVAPTDPEKAQGQRALAISYAFAGDCRGAQKSDRTAFDFYAGSGDFSTAGEVANELGRICLDTGEIEIAYDWYRKGHETSLQIENISRARADLWEFRWAHARGRIAARRGKPAEAAKYVAAARAILDRGTNPDQEVFFPYLEGYVAFYGGNYAGAVAALERAGDGDPFIQLLIAESYERLGNAANAARYYRMAASATAHSVPAALARPAALRKLPPGEAAAR
jgi:tetratricopeptide (TPR) repeat protein